MALGIGGLHTVVKNVPGFWHWLWEAGYGGHLFRDLANSHIVIVGGGTILLTGITWYVLPRFTNRPLYSTALAGVSFWCTLLGVLGFYTAWLVLGLVEGDLVRQGWDYAVAKEAIGAWHRVPTMITSSIMGVGYWTYVLNVFLLLPELTGRVAATAPALPPDTNRETGQSSGATTSPPALGSDASLLTLGSWRFSPRHLTLVGIAGGIGAYYLVTLVTGLLRLGYLHQGLSDGQAAAALGWIAPAALLLTALPLAAGYLAFGSAVYRATGAYRARFWADLRAEPARFTGPLPPAVRRRPAWQTVCLELLGGLFGFPGLGWLYPGQAMVGVALLLAGPALAWALWPYLFSPFNDTVFTQWNWLVLLIWLPVSSLLSAGALAVCMRAAGVKNWRASPAIEEAASGSERLPSRSPAPARQTEPAGFAPPSGDAVSGNVASPASPNSRLLPGEGPRVRAARRPSTIPRAALIGTLFVLVALFSVPVLPWLIGIPEEAAPQPIMPGVPERGTGAYLEVGDGGTAGLIKLYAWNFLPNQFPAEAPANRPAEARAIVISQKGLDEPDRYQLFHLSDGDPVPLIAQPGPEPGRLVLVPKEPLTIGPYVLAIPIGGMFAGREYYILRIDPTARSVLAAPANDQPAGPVIATPALLTGSALPLTAALISGLAALTLVQRLRQRWRAHEGAWAVAFGLFATAAGAQVAGDLLGWTGVLARLYYGAGATLVVGWLGLGTWLLLVRGGWLRQAGIWAVVLLSGYAAGLLTLTPVDTARLAADGWRALEPVRQLTLLTIGLNSAGTVLLVGGALWSTSSILTTSIWRCRLAWPPCTGAISRRSGNRARRGRCGRRPVRSCPRRPGRRSAHSPGRSA